MNVFDVLAYIAIVVMFGIVNKLWSSLDTYFEKKAENLATKQDVTEITLKTEQVQADFHKILGRFDADLRFKYEFYEKQYSELYSSLFCMVCESESLRYVLTRLSDEQIVFCEIPIVEYEIYNDGRESQEIEASICGKMLNLISDKYVYASPSLIKLAYALINTEKFETTVESAERRRIFELHLKKEIVRIILKDYYWLREQLHLQENIDESGKVETGNFASI